MNLNDIRINGKAYTEGVWVDDIDALPGVSLLVRAPNNDRTRRLQAKFAAELPIDYGTAGRPVNPKWEDETEVKIIAETILLDWKGIEGDDGQPLPFSKKAAAKILRDPDFRMFKAAVLWASGDATNRKRL